MHSLLGSPNPSFSTPLSSASTGATIVDAFLEKQPAHTDARAALTRICDETLFALHAAMLDRAACNREFSALNGDAMQARRLLQKRTEQVEATMEQIVRTGRRQLRSALGMSPDWGPDYDPLTDPALSLMKRVIGHNVEDIRKNHGACVIILPSYWGKKESTGFSRA